MVVSPFANPEKSTAFFSSPYRSSASNLSPVPENHPGNRESSSLSSPSNSDSHSPLLPIAGYVERGRYPFSPPPTLPKLLTKVRVAMTGKGMARNWALKRLLWAAILGGVFLLVFRHDRDGVLPERQYAADIHSTPADIVPYAQSTGKSFRLPSIIPFRSSQPSSTATQKDESRRPIDISSDSLPVNASLRERLEVWRNAPGGRGEIEGEIELGGFVQWNLEQCGEWIHEQHNTHMIQKSVNVWATMNRTTLHQRRTELIDHMETVLTQRLTEDYGEGRGIVMVAGNADTLRRVKWSIQMLRSYQSTLPVQIYHFPSERPADTDPIWEELKELGVELVEAKGQERDKGKAKSYHLKAIAVVQSPWREVLYLDSDSIPTRDPEYMFDAPNYLRLGLWATPDYWKTSANNPIWAITGVKCRNEWEMETGQMFVDKKLHLDVFLLIKYMLERHEWWFYFSDGDKDIFRWAMLALRKRWGVPGRWVGAGALPSGTASGEFCAHTMIQYDSWGEPLFVHYNLLKQIPSGVGRGYSWGRTKHLPLFNLWPATPSTARKGEPEEKPEDDDLPGLGDVDCDMLADADESGRARSPAKEMIMRRAVREQGVKVRYHGGWISALCIDLDYIDPRSEERKQEDEIMREQVQIAKEQRQKQWEDEVRAAKVAGSEEPEKPEELVGSVVPDWGQSPIEVVQWGDSPYLSHFENKIYEFGFVPSAPGF